MGGGRKGFRAVGGRVRVPEFGGEEGSGGVIVVVVFEDMDVGGLGDESVSGMISVDGWVAFSGSEMGVGVETGADSVDFGSPPTRVTVEGFEAEEEEVSRVWVLIRHSQSSPFS